MQLLLQRDRRVMIRIDAGHARAGRTQIVVDGVGEKCANLVAECEIGVAPVQIHRRVPICRSSVARVSARKPAGRSEEHTSELQSLMRISYAVFCLNKKKIKVEKKHTTNQLHKQQRQKRP